MEEIIVSVKKEVLVEMVKLAQKKEMAGSKGRWKEFLKVWDKKHGASLSDPSRRNIDSLDAFLKTFTKSDDLKFFKKVLQCHPKNDEVEVEQFKKTSPDNETAEQVKELDAGKLLVHNIPVNVLCEDLQNVLPGDFTLQMKINKKNTYSAFAILKNMEEANEAFENLEGDLEKDSSGRPQKLVKFNLGSGISGSLYIRKTCRDDSGKQLESKKRSVGDEDISGTFKKSRTYQTCGPIQEISKCEVHLKEFQRLKEELTHRDQEISNLNRIIAALARKQGL